jgi:hypothetical protein
MNNYCCQQNWVRPEWEGAVTATVNGLTGAVVSGLFLQSVSALQGGVISAVANIAGYVLINVCFDESSFDGRFFTYIFSHLVSLPTLAYGSQILGWSFSLPAMIGLAVVNCVASIFGRGVVDAIKDAFDDN